MYERYEKEKQEWKVGGWSLTGNNCRSFLVLEAISPVLYLPLNIYWHHPPPDDHDDDHDVDDHDDDHDVDDHDGDDESIFEDEDDTDSGDDPDEDDHDDHQIVCIAGSFEEIWLPLGDDDDYDKDHCGDWL